VIDADYQQALHDRRVMSCAILQAERAWTRGQRPFGCVIIHPTRGVVALTGGSESRRDPTAHCEVHAIQIACRILDGLLVGCTMYSTHEPCAMCCGAICHSKISRVVFGSWRADMPDLFRQRRIDVFDLLSDTTVPVRVQGGVRRHECVALFDVEREDHAIAFAQDDPSTWDDLDPFSGDWKGR
jgi:tRNA(adenine34) deaminase